MNKINYDELMISQASAAGENNKLLLHCCCAPCSSACLERLKDYFKITVLFYNPNIEDKEYFKRKDELIRLINETGWADFCDCDYDENAFHTAICGLESEKEGGKRCAKCFLLRLEKTRDLAEKGGYNYFATTLTLSPLKNAELINKTGESLQTEKVKWLYSDFKKRDGYKRSLELSKKYNLYRQDFCGCEYSRRERLENNNKK